MLSITLPHLAPLCFAATLRRAGLSEAEAEMDAIEAVHKSGGAVARPVALRDGSFVFDLAAPEAVRPAVLFHEARGTDLTYGGPDGPDNARRYGRAVARLHYATSHLGPPAGRSPLDIQAILEIPRITIASRLPDELDGEPDWLGSY